VDSGAAVAGRIANKNSRKPDATRQTMQHNNLAGDNNRLWNIGHLEN
jgi:hypothetical protein